MIGHEITHGFDDQGRQNEKDGNAVPWWTNATLEVFQSHAQCIVDQYDSIRLPELDGLLPNATLNGVNTQVGRDVVCQSVCLSVRLGDRTTQRSPPLLRNIIHYQTRITHFKRNENRADNGEMRGTSTI